jgi:hypothetical protein
MLVIRAAWSEREPDAGNDSASSSRRDSVVLRRRHRQRTGYCPQATARVEQDKLGLTGQLPSAVLTLEKQAGCRVTGTRLRSAQCVA